MIDVWSAVQWWDEWQLRILVLASLSLQWFMLVAAPLRKYTIPQFLRTLTWLAYISSDALAIYALATLFNRHAKASNGVSCSGSNGGTAGILEILWAPVLLIHLGGQREVTAYTIEDNELWTRHMVTLVSQVAVAAYAFYKSWPSSADPRLRVTAVLLFVVGVLSFCEKPWAFYRARIHRLEAVSRLIQGTSPRENKCLFCFKELDEEKVMRNVVRCSFCCGAGGGAPADDGVWSRRNKMHMLLSDLSLYAAATDQLRREQPQMSAASLAKEVKYLLGGGVGGDMFARRWLVKAFGVIYTRYNVVWTPAYLAYHLLLVPALHAAAIALFAVSHKRGVYKAADVKTTYILLSFTAALDFFGVFFAELLHWVMTRLLGVPALCEWIARYNLIDAALQRVQPRTIMGRFIVWCGLERYFLPKRDNLFNKVAGDLIFDLLYKIKPAYVDLGNYRNLDEPSSFSTTEERRRSSNWNWALKHDLRREASKNKYVRDSLRGPFDKSVLIWHIATDLCFCRDPPAFPRHPREVCTEAISNYMSYLLNFHPDMLMTGSRRHLFSEAMDNIKEMLEPEVTRTVGLHFKRPNIDSDRAIEKCIFRCAYVPEGGRNIQYPLVNDACRLAQDLLSLPQDTRSELIYRVWLGMLCYSATMCRGYLHAKSLGEGGEFLSFVWLLLATTGSRTLADKLQMPDQDTDTTHYDDSTEKDEPEYNIKDEDV